MNDTRPKKKKTGKHPVAKNPSQAAHISPSGGSAYATGGVVGQPPLPPGPEGMPPPDPMMISATPGEMVIPPEVVNYLGQKFFNDLIQKVQAEMAGGGQPNPFTDLAGAAPGEGLQ